MNNPKTERELITELRGLKIREEAKADTREYMQKLEPIFNFLMS
jgi:hypothetical protein